MDPLQIDRGSVGRPASAALKPDSAAVVSGRMEAVRGSGGRPLTAIDSRFAAPIVKVPASDPAFEDHA